MGLFHIVDYYIDIRVVRSFHIGNWVEKDDNFCSEIEFVLKSLNMANDSYLPQLLAEKDTIDSTFVHASKLLSRGKVTERIHLINTMAIRPSRYSMPGMQSSC